MARTIPASTRVTEAEWSEWRERAAEEGRTISGFLRAAARERIQRPPIDRVGTEVLRAVEELATNHPNPDVRRAIFRRLVNNGQVVRRGAT